MHNIKTWAERSFADDSKQLATAYMLAEIAELRAALASSATTEPSDLAAAMQRVQQYMARRKKARALDFEHIHGFDVGPNCGFELLASDIQSLLAALAKQVPAQEQDKIDAQRYRFVKTMSKEQLLFWRGAYGFSDAAIDAAQLAQS